MTLFRSILITMAVTGTLLSGMANPAWAAPKDKNCMTDQQIQTAISAGQIQKWAQIRKIAGIPDDNYETSTVQVCLRAGVPYYIVNMSSPKGENFKIVLNAVNGSV